MANNNRKLMEPAEGIEILKQCISKPESIEPNINQKQDNDIYSPRRIYFEERYRELVELLPQTIFELDIDGNCRFTNKYGFETFGYTPEDIENGVHFLQLFIPEDRKRVAENIRQITHGRDVETHRYTVLRKDGSTFQALIFSNSIRKNEQYCSIRGIVIDITDHLSAEQAGKQLEDELKNSRDQLRNLSAHLQSIREEERANIAREIHDELGQALTALKMDLNWLNKKIPPEQEILLQKVDSMSRLIDLTIQNIRRLSTELRPGLLDDLGLTAAIEWYCEEFQKRTGIQCHLRLGRENISLDQELAIAVFRIFQETLTNVARHSQATDVEAILTIQDHLLEMEIRDNGVGIPEEKINDPKSFGLIGVRERVYPWGGNVEFKGFANIGTLVSIVIPLDHKENP